MEWCSSLIWTLALYRIGEEKSIEKYKARIQIKEEHHSISAFKRNLIDFLFSLDTTREIQSKNKSVCENAVAGI